jgi:hypothetical protein
MSRNEVTIYSDNNYSLVGNIEEREFKGTLWDRQLGLPYDIKNVYAERSDIDSKYPASLFQELHKFCKTHNISTSTWKVMY